MLLMEAELDVETVSDSTRGGSGGGGGRLDELAGRGAGRLLMLLFE